MKKWKLYGVYGTSRFLFWQCVELLQKTDMLHNVIRVAHELRCQGNVDQVHYSSTLDLIIQLIIIIIIFQARLLE